MTEPTEVRAAEVLADDYVLDHMLTELDPADFDDFNLAEAERLVAGLLAQVPDGCDVVIRRDGTLMALEANAEKAEAVRDGDGWSFTPLYALRAPRAERKEGGG